MVAAAADDDDICCVVKKKTSPPKLSQVLASDHRGANLRRLLVVFTLDDYGPLAFIGGLRAGAFPQLEELAVGFSMERDPNLGPFMNGSDVVAALARALDEGSAPCASTIKQMVIGEATPECQDKIKAALPHAELTFYYTRRVVG